MPIADLQQAAQKIAGFLSSLNKLGGMRLNTGLSREMRTRSTGTGSARDLRGTRRPPMFPLLTQHNGELLRALETIASQMPSAEQRENDLVRLDAATSRRCARRSCRMSAEVAAEKVPEIRGALCIPAAEQPRAPPVAYGISRSAGRRDSQLGEGQDRFPCGLSEGKTNLAGDASHEAA